MTKYAVVSPTAWSTARDPVKSPFDFVYHAAQESSAARGRDVIDDTRFATYFGDLAGSGLSHVAFTGASPRSPPSTT
jgi:hypothetical protein